MKIDPPMWIAAVFECINVPVEFTSHKEVCDVNSWQNQNSFMEKLFVNKIIGKGYNTVKTFLIDNLNIEKEGYTK